MCTDYDTNDLKSNLDQNKFTPKCKDIHDFVNDVKKNPKTYQS